MQATATGPAAPRPANPASPRAAAPLRPADPLLLLVEPDYMLRRTVVLTARSVILARIHECSGYDEAELLLQDTRYDGLLLALGENPQNDPGVRLLEKVRAGQTRCDPQTPIAVVAQSLNRERADKLVIAGVARIVVRPVKARTLLQALDAIAGAPPAPRGARVSPASASRP